MLPAAVLSMRAGAFMDIIHVADTDDAESRLFSIFELETTW